MKNSDKKYYITLIFLAILILAVLLDKFWMKNNNGGTVQINNLDAISLYDLDDHPMVLTEILDQRESMFIFIFELTNCYSCIYNGFEDLKKIEKAGSPCLAIAVHDRVDEVNGWSKNTDFQKLFVLKKAEYYKYIKNPYLPVIVNMKAGKVQSYWHIKNVTN